MKDTLQGDGSAPSFMSSEGRSWIGKLRDLCLRMFDPEEVRELGLLSNAKRSEAHIYVESPNKWTGPARKTVLSWTARIARSWAGKWLA